MEGVKCCGLSWNPYIYVKDNAVNAIDPTGNNDEVEYQNLTTNATRVARSLKYPTKVIRCAIHALKRDLAGQFEGNPDVLIDVTSGNAYLPVSLDFLGCILDYIPD